jgi:hypothetical protein
MPGVFVIVILSADDDRRLVELAKRVDKTIHEVAKELLTEALFLTGPPVERVQGDAGSLNTARLTDHLKQDRERLEQRVLGGLAIDDDQWRSE